MSETETKVTTGLEPVQVSNKYDGSQLKNAVDDELARFYSKELGFKQSHVHTDIKLLLGYVSCIIAGGAFFYEYKTSFNEAIHVTIMAVVSYWIIQAIAFGYYYLVEKDEIYSGTQTVDGKVTGTLKISGKFDKFSPIYDLTFDYTDKSTGKSATYKIQPNVTTWFTEEGNLVNDAMDKDLKSYLTKVESNLHQH